MLKMATKTVAIIGHTDNSGNRTSNIALSQARADAVKGYLVAKGIPPQQNEHSLSRTRSAADCIERYGRWPRTQPAHRVPRRILNNHRAAAKARMKHEKYAGLGSLDPGQVF